MPTPKLKNVSRFLFVAIVTVPVVSGMVYAALYSLGIIGILNTEISSKAWQTVFFGKPFWSAIGFSLYISVVSMAISLAVALLISIKWQKNLRDGLLGTAIYFPLCFPGTVMAFFSFQMLSKSGFVSRLGFNMGWIEDLRVFPSWIHDAYGIGIIFTSVLLITPFFIILFSNLFKTENIASFQHLAKTFGASNRQILWKVTLPILLKRASVTIYLFTIFIMGSYEVPLLLGRQDPQMISVAIIQKIQRFNLNDIPQGYAMSILYVLLILSVVILLFFRNKNFFKTSAV
ncbi:ABC transporter permease subunit [Aequorivita echinoideorum]|uniref:ABC transporter permease subunit n=1 Tax=Aequorivita echinoideorum TaxID=1549647 RepID=A0ABS5S6H0_9FLAO|nr:ABC transporter permease subunit [Aequorivita echinoideorum]MBT0607435.1 ABC transporter permease subunit [Aequorivita echinoideorum]